MVHKTPLTRVLFGHCRKAVGLLVLGVFFVSTIVAAVATGVNPKPVSAATNSTLNFQARLQNAAGGIVADGYYNIEFKLYNVSSAGSSLWTEDYYDANGATAGSDNRVRVKNGYISVNLGSQTAFPNTINWDQDLWLTMNVGGTTQTATPSWDGEMNPRLKLTAVPYAFKAGQLAQNNGSYTSTLSLAAPTNGNQSFVIPDQGAAGTYNLVTQNYASANYIQNTTSPQTANLSITGNGVFGGYVDATGGFKVNGSVGATTTCNGGQLIQNATIVGGIVTNIACATASSSGVTTVGTIDSQTKSADGATIVGTSIYMQTADATHPGLVGTGTQTFAGDKTFSGVTNFQNTVTVTGNPGVNELFVSDGTSKAVFWINNAYSTAAVQLGTYTNDNLGFFTNNGSTSMILKTDNNLNLVSGGLQTAGTTRLDNSGNLLNINSIGAAGSSAMNITANAASTWKTTAGNLTLDSGSGTLVLGTNTTTLQKASTAFSFDLNNSSNSTFTITNGGTGVASLAVEGGVAIGSGQVYKVGATSGASIDCTSGGQFLQNAVVQGGIVTGGSCVAASNGVTTVGTFSNTTSYANGATISGTTITMGAADGSNPGLLTAADQTIGGNKTFNGTITGSTFIAGSATMAIGNNALNKTINLGATGTTANTTTLNIATSTGAAQTVNIGGTGASGGSNSSSTVTAQGGATALKVANGGVSVQTYTNSTSAFQVKNANGLNLISTDTNLPGGFNQIISDGGFETGTSGWSGKNGGSITQITTPVSAIYQGSAAAQISMSAINSGASYTVISSSAYNLSFYARASTGTITNLNFGYVSGGSDVDCATNQTVTSTGFTRFSCNIPAVSISSVYIKESSAVSQTLYIDGVQLYSGASSTSPFGIGAIQLNGMVTSPLVLQNSSDSTTAFQIQNAAGTSNTLVVDTMNNRIAIGKANAAYSLDVSGEINASTGFRVNGTQGLASLSCGASQAIQNATVVGGIITAGACTAASNGVTTVGTFSGTSIANGASISGNTLTLGVADGTNPGMLSTTNQSIAGVKTFTNQAIVNNTTAGDFALDVYNNSATGYGIYGFVNNNDGTHEALRLDNSSGNAFSVMSNGNVSFAGTASGNGSGLTNLNAGNISSGTLGTARGGTGSTSYTTNGVIYSNGSALVSTGAGTTGQCLVATTSAAPSWGACGTGNSTTMQDTYNNSTNPQIQLNSTKGAITYKDASSTIGNLFQLQNSAGTATYFNVSSTAVTMQNSSGNTVFSLDMSGGHFKVFNASNSANYADVYWDSTNSQAVFAASSGNTTRVGNGSGNIVLQLSNAADVLTGTKTVSLSGAYSSNDFSFSRTITAGANSLTGSVLKVESNSTGTSTLNSNVLWVNQQNTSDAGNLIVATAGGSGNNKFVVSNTGAVTTAGIINGTVGFSVSAGQAYTGTGAVTLSSGASSLLTVAGTAGVNITTGTGNLQIGSATTDTTANLLVLDSYSNSTDPTGVNGAMYYNTSMNSFRCQENGVWRSCIGGLVNSSTAASTAITGTTTKTNFTGGTNNSYTVLANDCQPGVTYLITAQGTFTSTSATPTLTLTLNMDGTATTLATSGAMALASTTQGWQITAQMICTSTTTVEVQGVALVATSATATGTSIMSNTATKSWTTTSHTLNIGATLSSTTGTPSVTMRQFIVQRVGP